MIMIMVLSLLPYLSFFLVLFFSIKPGKALRDSCLAVAVVWGGAIVLMTEGLSLAHAFNRTGIAVGWVVFSLFFPLKELMRRKKSSDQLAQRNDTHFLELKFLLLPVVLILGITFISAFLTPPNNWDGHSYHIARIMHWEQNQSVAHYPTAMEKQLIFPPWAEFAISHTIILGKTDALSNLLQWFSFFLALIAVSNLAKKMGLSEKSQMITVLLAATLPMALLQSVTVQNDLVTTCWVLIFLNFWWDAVQRTEKSNPVLSRLNILMGLSAGLAVLTKGTAPIYLALFFIVLFLKTFANSKMKAVFQMLLVGGTALSINAGHFIRNIQVFGVPLGTPPGLSLANEEVSLRVLISNLLRNSLLHFPLPARLSGVTRSLVDFFHLPLGLDPLDPKTSFEGSTFSAPFLQVSEHVAGNPFQMLFICMGLFLVLKRLKNKQLKFLWPFIFSFVGAVLLFCLLLKWQQYNSRLHLPFFFMALPVAVLAFNRWSKSLNVLAVLTVLMAIPSLFFSQTHPWFGQRSIFRQSKSDLYFIERPMLMSRFHQVSEKIQKQKCQKIGLTDAGSETWEYPLWILLDSQRTKIEMKYIDVQQKSGKLMSGDFNPCAVVSLAQVRLLE